MNNKLSKTIKSLPSNPGVYLFIDSAGVVLYVGKAKNLKKRVSQYFQKSKKYPHSIRSTSQNNVKQYNNITIEQLSNRTIRQSDNRTISPVISNNPRLSIMINKIANLEYIITDTEAEALLLEATLIKKHKPQYNIILRDDKNFLYIKLNLQEEWPRIELVRKPTVVNKSNKNNKRNKLINAIKASRSERNKSKLFGPYPSADSARHTYKLISRIFKICACKNFLKKPCLKYHLNWCLCPAETKISNNEYRQIFDQIAKFLNGQTAEILQDLKHKMKQSSSQKEYETAARLRDQIKAIEAVTAKQKIISVKKENYDVISLARDKATAVINLFIVREGKLTNKLNFILEHTKNSTNPEIIESFINQYYSTAIDIPKKIIVPTKINCSMVNVQCSISLSRRGTKAGLLKLGQQNVQDYLHQVVNNVTIQQCNNEMALNNLKKLLHLPSYPNRIECYDISNISGQNATGSMVVFTNGQPDKSEYRKFSIKGYAKLSPHARGGAKGGWEKPNDVAMMAEVVSRRFKNTTWPKPDLILLDGGKPQLNAILKIDAVKLSIINYQLSIIGLAKREEHIFLTNRNQPVILPLSSPVLQLLQRVRDEAHRFAKNYFLKQHQKSALHSALDDIPGLGPKTKKKLLHEFGSVNRIKNASQNKLAKITNKRMTKKIKEF